MSKCKPINFICARCGIPCVYTKGPANFSKHEKHYCSRACAAGEPHKPINAICAECRQPFIYKYGKQRYLSLEKHYCSHACRQRTHGLSKLDSGDIDAIRIHMLYASRDRAKNKKLPHTLTLEDVPIIPLVCPILGIPILHSYTKPTPNSPSLDRINPPLGYVPGNVRIISYRANTLRNNATAAELILIANDATSIERLINLQSI